MDRISVSMWPEVADYRPLCHSMPTLHRANDVQLDFDACRLINASGLASALLRILRICSVDAYRRSWLLHADAKSPVLANISRLNFPQLLYEVASRPAELEFKSQEALPTNEYVESSLGGGIRLHSYPIYRISHGQFRDRREPIHDFLVCIDRILRQYGRCDLNIVQFLMLLKEILKNSADHTISESYFGMDVWVDRGNTVTQISFTLGDLGHGIKKEIELFMAKSKLALERIPKMSFYEAYYYALQEGFSTSKSSKNNFGLGMTIIRDAAVRLGLSLSIFDAESRCLLDRIDGDAHSHSHRELRRSFIRLGTFNTFCYYGEYNARPED
jgi:hypothetical protein